MDKINQVFSKAQLLTPWAVGSFYKEHMGVGNLSIFNSIASALRSMDWKIN